MLKSIQNHAILLAGLMLLVSANAWAEQPACNTLGDNQKLCSQSVSRFNGLQAEQTPTFLDIARDSDGKVKYMNQSAAFQYCANRGAHLPSARELAYLSMNLGAKGVVGACGSDKPCYPIQARNADGSGDSFYFSQSRYQRPAGDMGNNWFWSSSVATYHPYVLFLFSGGDGGIYTESHDYSNAVRCVAGH